MSFLTFFQEKIAENEYDVSDFCSFLTRKSQAVRGFLYSSSLQFFLCFLCLFVLSDFSVSCNSLKTYHYSSISKLQQKKKSLIPKFSMHSLIYVRSQLLFRVIRTRYLMNGNTFDFSRQERKGDGKQSDFFPRKKKILSQS